MDMYLCSMPPSAYVKTLVCLFILSHIDFKETNHSVVFLSFFVLSIAEQSANVKALFQRTSCSFGYHPHQFPLVDTCLDKETNTLNCISCE